MAKVLLGVTGSVAAIKTPDLYQALRAAGHEVKIVATSASLYFFDPLAIESLQATPPARNREVLILDEDEWSRERYQRGDVVLHIELRRWAELFVIAPLDANTLAKLANGLCDNCLTCVWRAWDRTRPVLLAPAMNTLMWDNPMTRRHFGQLVESQDKVLPQRLDLESAVAWINEYCPALTIQPPISKRLACDDVGVGAMADIETIVAAVEKLA